MVTADQLSQVGSRQGLRDSPPCRLEIQQGQETVVTGCCPIMALAPKEVKIGAILKSSEEKTTLKQVLDHSVKSQSFAFYCFSLAKDTPVLKDKELGHKEALGQRGLGEIGPAVTFKDINQNGSSLRCPLENTLC